MLLNMLKGKIHLAVVTHIAPDDAFSITIDEELMEQAGIHEYEKVQVVDEESGRSLETHVVAGKRDGGMICLNGNAARLVRPGGRVLIMAYALMTPEEADISLPRVVFVDGKNRIVHVTRYEKHGRLENT